MALLYSDACQIDASADMNQTFFSILRMQNTKNSNTNTNDMDFLNLMFTTRFKLNI